MARILVVGSRKTFGPTQFRSACQLIGRALAEHRHTIVAAGCGDDDAETWVLEGANSAAKPGTRCPLIPFAPAQPGTQDLIMTANIAGRWPNLQIEPPFQTKGPWAVGQAVALLRSDAALLIGGGPLTANVGSLGLELDKPYYSVSKLGGAAETLAGEDYAKHRTMGMKEELIAPSVGDPSFGERVVAGIEFLMEHRKERLALRNSALILGFSLVILGLFVWFLFQRDPLGKEPRLVYTTCAGAIVGVLLAFLVGRVVDGKVIRLSELLGQAALACFLGVLYGFFSLEAGGFYNVDISSMSIKDLDSLALKMAMVGIGVGALLGPASKRALEELRQNAKLGDS